MQNVFQNERVIQAINEIAADGKAFAKYQNDKEVLAAFNTFCSLMDGKKS